MAIRRRDFLRIGATGLFFAGATPSCLFSFNSLFSPEEIAPGKTLLQEQLFSDEFPFPYDQKVFECAERISCIRPATWGGEGWRANLNLVLKEGKNLDLKVLVSDQLEGLSRTKTVLEFTGVRDWIDIQLEIPEARRAYYQVLYREGQAAWKALSPKSFKLPHARLEKGEAIKVIFIGDDHTFDDADYDVPESSRTIKLNGDYVNEFLKELRKNPNAVPKKPLGVLKNGYYLALALRHIMAYEDPDFLVLLGDTTGIGANYKWAKYGLPTTNLTERDYDWIARLFWLRMRKLYSALTPSVPIFIVLGNHDGEEQWNAAGPYATFWRRKFFAQPEASTYPEGGHVEGKYYAFSWGADRNNRGGVLFIVLNTTAFAGPVYPSRLEQWTLGQEQRSWLDRTLAQAEKDWIFLCSHHVLGGWPAGPEEARRDIVYGRGPLFTQEDYREYGEPEKIEQVWITEKAKEHGARVFIYGHDHIFFSRNIGPGLNNLDVYGLCVGSTKYMGEKLWWDGALWRKHYGRYDRTSPDFWGPSGITRATIMAKEARFDYLMTGWTAYSNLPTNLAKSSVLSSIILASPPVQLACDPNSLSFRGVESGPNPEPQKLRVKNSGSGRLEFRLVPGVAWLKVSPVEGQSWGKWQSVSVSVDLTEIEEGRYEGTISIESNQAKNSPLKIKAELVVDPPPIYAPLNFMGWRKQKKILGRQQIVILLSWQANPLNKKIEKYRLFRLGDAAQWVILAEVAKNKRSFLVEKVPPSGPLTFGVAAVDYKGREGPKAVVIVS